MTKTKAYSYLRISTDRQLSGDGIRRQLEQSKAYAEQHDFELVETLQDIGVSAFKGKNAKEGALGMFIAAIDDGDIEQGSVLIVESLDRLSRDNVLTAFNQFTNIIQKGIGIVTLTDNQHYTTESISNNFSQLLISLTVMMRANEESVTKSRRLKAAFARKRDNLAKEKFSAMAPAWLKLAEDRKSFHMIEDKARTMREIYRLCIDGMGISAITKHLNEQRDKYPPFGDSKVWYTSYVARILKKPAVYGQFQSEEWVGDKKVPRGEPVENYYPVVIDKETYDLAQSRMKSRANRKGAGAKGTTYSNLFSGMITCGDCGNKVVLKNKGKPPKGYKYLRCSHSLHGEGCSSPSWRYSEFEEAFIDFVREVNFSEILGEHDSSAELRELDAKTATANVELAEQKQSYDTLLARFEDPQIPEDLVTALVKRSQDIKTKIAETEDRIAVFAARKAELSTENISEDQETFLDAYEAVLEEKDETKLRELRFAMAGLLKRVVSNITTHNSMTLNPWEASFNAVSKRLGTELKEKGRKTDAALEAYFSTLNGQRYYQQAERYFMVKFVSGAVRVVQPYENATFKSVTERMLKFRTS